MQYSLCLSLPLLINHCNKVKFVWLSHILIKFSVRINKICQFDQSVILIKLLVCLDCTISAIEIKKYFN